MIDGQGEEGMSVYARCNIYIKCVCVCVYVNKCMCFMHVSHTEWAQLNRKMGANRSFSLPLEVFHITQLTRTNFILDEEDG